MDTVQEKIPEELEIAKSFWEIFLQEEFPDQNQEDHFLHEMVNDLLYNQKGHIDIRQIGKLNRWGSKIKNKNYHKFLEHLNQAYDTKHTKRYEQFLERNDQGEYDSLILTYSKADPVESTE